MNGTEEKDGVLDHDSPNSDKDSNQKNPMSSKNEKGSDSAGQIPSLDRISS